MMIPASPYTIYIYIRHYIRGIKKNKIRSVPGAFFVSRLALGVCLSMARLHIALYSSGGALGMRIPKHNSVTLFYS